MAGERTLPGLDLYGFWTDGSDGYGDQVGDNFRKLSIMAQPSVISRVSTLPSSPADKSVYIFVGSGTNANKIAARDAGAWVFYAPPKGMLAWVQSEKKLYLFDGTSWVYAFPTQNVGYNKLIITGSGTYAKPATADRFIITTLGGGGGGGGVRPNEGDDTVGGNGGPGGVAVTDVAASALPATVSMVIGAGGTGGNGATGAAGGNTTFGSICQASGGKGGILGDRSQGVRVPKHGEAGIGLIGNKQRIRGAASDPSMAPYPGGAGPLIPTNRLGENGASAEANSGAGGAGASQHHENESTFRGGNGGSGLIIIEEFYL